MAPDDLYEIELRDMFAGQAMQGMLLDGRCGSNDDIALFSYDIADSMLRARKNAAVKAEGGSDVDPV